MSPLPLIGWDTETHLFSDAAPCPRVVVHALAPPPEMGAPWLDTSSHSIEHLLKLARDQQIVLAAHYAAYDIKCTIRTSPHLTPLVFEAMEAGGLLCTIVMHKLTVIASGGQPSPRYSLSDLNVQVLGREPLAKGNDTWRLKYAELDGVPLEQWPAEAKAYAIHDACVARDLGAALPQWPDAPAQTMYDFAFAKMTDRGMHVDQEMVEQERAAIEAKQAEVTQGLQSAGVVRANGTKDMVAVRSAVEQVCGQLDHAIPKTPTGATKTDRATLTRLGVVDGPLALLRQSKQLEKIESAYLSKFAKVGSAPLRPFVDVLKRTGRASMSSPALQQIPRGGKIRECLAARPGYVYLSADLDTAELRSLAQACLDTVGFSQMAKAYWDDSRADLHLILAARLLGRDLADVVEGHKHGEPVVKDARQRAKAVNFGLPGAMGVKRFVENQADMGVTVSHALATAMKREWEQQWPEMPRYFKYVKNMLDTAGYVTTRISQRPRGGCSLPEGANYGFQSRTADVAKLLAYLIVRESILDRASPLHNSYLVHFMHDEVIIEVPEARGARAAQRVYELVKMAGGLHLLNVPSESTPCLARRWYKKAEAVYNPDGELTLWEPEE